jgi:hypothetical protein
VRHPFMFVPANTQAVCSCLRPEWLDLLCSNCRFGQRVQH